MRRRSPASELSGRGEGWRGNAVVPRPPYLETVLKYTPVRVRGRAAGDGATKARRRHENDQSGERERSTQQQELTARDTSDATQATSRERFFEFDYSPHACNCMRVECEYCPPAGAPSLSS